MAQHLADLFPGHNHRKTAGFSGTNEALQCTDFAGKNMAIEEKQGAEGLRLCRGADILLEREMRQEGIDLWPPISAGWRMWWKKMNRFTQCR